MLRNNVSCRIPFQNLISYNKQQISFLQHYYCQVSGSIDSWLEVLTNWYKYYMYHLILKLSCAQLNATKRHYLRYHFAICRAVRRRNQEKNSKRCFANSLAKDQQRYNSRQVRIVHTGKVNLKFVSFCAKYFFNSIHAQNTEHSTSVHIRLNNDPQLSKQYNNILSDIPQKSKHVANPRPTLHHADVRNNISLYIRYAQALYKSRNMNEYRGVKQKSNLS